MLGRESGDVETGCDLGDGAVGLIRTANERRYNFSLAESEK